MTAGFVVFGVAVPIYALVLRRALQGGAWVAAIVCGVATLGVAAVPLGRGSDGWHGTLAGIGYVALALVPTLAVMPLRRSGRRRWAVTSAVLAAVAAACLVATTLGPAHGLFQRMGLAAGDAWLVMTALVILRWGRLDPT